MVLSIEYMAAELLVVMVKRRRAALELLAVCLVELVDYWGDGLLLLAL